MVNDLVVVASYGGEHLGDCLKSLGTKYQVWVADEKCPVGYSGKYLWAYWKFPEVKNFMFMQDSMVATEGDYLEEFKKEGSPCAWAHFNMAWDTPRQKELGHHYFEGEPPPLGIFGPVFYVSREHLDTLRDKKLLPPIPVNKEQAQGTERYWAWAFHAAGIEVKSLHPFSKTALESGLKPFKKTFADRQ